MNLTEEELVKQNHENPYRLPLICLDTFLYSASFDPSMMACFYKRLPDSVVSDCKERIVPHVLNAIRSAGSLEKQWPTSWLRRDRKLKSIIDDVKPNHEHGSPGLPWLNGVEDSGRETDIQAWERINLTTLERIPRPPWHR